MKIALVGATGNVGGRALQALVAAGASVVALARHPEKLPRGASSSVEIAQGDLSDEDFVLRATSDAQVLFWMTPPAFGVPDFKAHALQQARNAARALQRGVARRVVFLSSHGAGRAGLGHASLAGDVEKILTAASPDVVSLRSAGLMENLRASVPALGRGQLFGVLPPEARYPLVATRDLGDVAARWLLDATWSGHQVHGVHGPEDLSPLDQANVLSRALDRPIRYQQVPLAAFADSLLAQGMSRSAVDGFVEMFQGFAEPGYRPDEPRTAETTTPTTLDAFARERLAPLLA